MSIIDNAIKKYNKALQQSEERRKEWISLSNHIFQALTRINVNNNLKAIIETDDSVKEFPKVLFTISPRSSINATLSFMLTSTGKVKYRMQHQETTWISEDEDVEPKIVTEFINLQEVDLYAFDDKSIDTAFVEFIDKLCEFEGYQEPGSKRSAASYFPS